MSFSIAIGMVLNFILLPLIGYTVWIMYSSFVNTGTRELKLQHLIGTILHLNESLSYSVNMASATGDHLWEAKYNEVQGELDGALAQVATLAKDAYRTTYIADTKTAYSKLIEADSLAFSLLKVGRKPEADAILKSPEYESGKNLYTGSLKNLADSVELNIFSELAYFKSRMKLLAFLGTASSFILLVGWIGVTSVVKRNIKYRMIAESESAARKEHLSVTLRSIGDGVISADINGNVVMINPVAEDLTGWTSAEAVGRPLCDVFTIVNEKTRLECENPINRVMRHGSVSGLMNNTVLIARDATERIIAHSAAPMKDSHGTVVGAVLIFRDITHAAKMQEELQKTEKLESLGILAGGIAHDFNNILAGILGNISLAKMNAEAGSRSHMRLIEAEKGIQRAKGLTQQLLAFSKGGTPLKETSEISALLKECIEFVLRGSNVKFIAEVDEDLWSVDIDKGQVFQVFHNLALNADQSMPFGGTLRVTAENRNIQSDEVPGLTAGRYVKISVIDEGVGIPRENLTKIFDPYFTTKPKGIGLGLASSYAIIKRHNGLIMAESEIDAGTAFHVFLPASAKGISDRVKTCASVQMGTGTILLMDDNEMIRQTAGEMLELLGYVAHVAQDGIEAFNLYRDFAADGKTFDAVILDLTIPGGTGGRDAVRLLKAFDPGVKVIVSSGYCNDPILSDYASYGFVDVLPKPYTAELMSNVLTRVLGAECAGRIAV